MALSKVERWILIAARGRIARGDSRFICCALDAVADQNRRSEISKARTRLKNYIMRKLGDCITLDSWMVEKGKIPRGYGFHHEVKQARLAWIDWMLGK